MQARMSVNAEGAWRARTGGGERGGALLVVLMASLLLSGLAAGLLLLSSAETLISANFRNTQEALYAAEAGVERAVQDLLATPDWTDVLSGGVQSGFVDSSLKPALPDGRTLDLTAATAALQQATARQGLWGANDPVWRLYAYGPMTDLLPQTIQSRSYVVVWVADDPSESDNEPLADSNGVLTLRAEGFALASTRRVLEATVSRTEGAAMERGYVGQRGQDEQNGRTPKAPVQNPGRALTPMPMDSASGGY